jgi:hypothetical protein
MRQLGCTGARALVIESSGGEEEEEEEEEDDETCCITVVTGLVGALVIHRTMRITIGPWGRPQGLLVPRTAIMLPTLLTPSLAAPPPLALPSSEACPSDSGVPPDLKSLCGN